MKRLLFLGLSLLIPIAAISQKIIELKLDNETKKLEYKSKDIKNIVKENLKVGNNYQFMIKDVNRSYINAKVTSESYYLASEVPAVISGHFIGIPGNHISISGMKAIVNPDFKKIFQETCVSYNKLKTLKSESNSLYDSIKVEPLDQAHLVSATTKLQMLEKEFGVSDGTSAPDIEMLKRHINAYIQYIFVAKSIFEKQIEIIPINKLNSYEFPTMYAEIQYIYENVKNENYLKYLSLLDKAYNDSKGADTVVMSKPFVAEKDLIDVEVTLIDSYTNDTIYNSTLTLYTKGRFNFDFSTGFF